MHSAGVFAADETAVQAIAHALAAAGYVVTNRATMADNDIEIAAQLAVWIDVSRLKLVVGPSTAAARSALEPLITKRLPAFSDIPEIDAGLCGAALVVLVPVLAAALQDALAKVLPRIELELAAKTSSVRPVKVSIPAIGGSGESGAQVPRRSGAFSVPASGSFTIPASGSFTVPPSGSFTVPPRTIPPPPPPRKPAVASIPPATDKKRSAATKPPVTSSEPGTSSPDAAPVVDTLDSDTVVESAPVELQAPTSPPEVESPQVALTSEVESPQVALTSEVESPQVASPPEVESSRTAEASAAPAPQGAAVAPPPPAEPMPRGTSGLTEESAGQPPAAGTMPVAPPATAAVTAAPAPARPSGFRRGWLLGAAAVIGAAGIVAIVAVSGSSSHGKTAPPGVARSTEQTPPVVAPSDMPDTLGTTQVASEAPARPGAKTPEASTNTTATPVTSPPKTPTPATTAKLKPATPATAKPATAKVAATPTTAKVAGTPTTAKPATTPTNPATPGTAAKTSDAAPPPAAGLPLELDRAMIGAGMATAKPDVVRCGEQSVAKGIVKLAVSVNNNGAVIQVTVSEAPEAALAVCVVNAVRKVTFAKTENGGSFSYPFRL